MKLLIWIFVCFFKLRENSIKSGGLLIFFQVPPDMTIKGSGFMAILVTCR